MISAMLHRWYESLLYSKDPVSLLQKLFLFLMKPFELIYRLCFMISYHGKIKAEKLKLPIPVISTGNITLGGTGKTPLVIYLFKLLRSRGYRTIAIITRGYGRKSSEDIYITTGDSPYPIEAIGDEPFLIKENLPDCMMLIGSDRKKLALSAYKDHNAEAVIMDDAFRHLDIQSLNCVTIDGSRKFGNKRLIPSGPLRQPISTLKHADCFVITKSLRDKELEILLSSYKKPVYYADYKSAGIFDGNREKSPQTAKAVIISGIANNDGFFNTCREAGIEIADYIPFPDHKKYSALDIKKITDKTKNKDFDFYLTTEKDFYKLRTLSGLLIKDLFYIGIDLEFSNNNDNEYIFDEQIIRSINYIWKSR